MLKQSRKKASKGPHFAIKSDQRPHPSAAKSWSRCRSGVSQCSNVDCIPGETPSKGTPWNPWSLMPLRGRGMGTTRTFDDWDDWSQHLFLLSYGRLEDFAHTSHFSAYSTPGSHVPMHRLLCNSQEGRIFAKFFAALVEVLLSMLNVPPMTHPRPSRHRQIMEDLWRPSSLERRGFDRHARTLGCHCSCLPCPLQWWARCDSGKSRCDASSTMHLSCSDVLDLQAFGLLNRSFHRLHRFPSRSYSRIHHFIH